MKEVRALIFVVVAILLLPTVYVASYLALAAKPSRSFRRLPTGECTARMTSRYRYGEPITKKIYWPLEQIDRALRPKVWNPNESTG
ncbi:hypothetical protein [Anatilimnocola floriformis]|uniref:hypothetical protein n=1 Tax=Anatilimnocola floriformis TaxID=2948575 RepID=UPI0020C2E8D6|nr:hypothetical protein [Anatilimnocola floriformis]